MKRLFFAVLMLCVLVCLFACAPLNFTSFDFSVPDAFSDLSDAQKLEWAERNDYVIRKNENEQISILNEDKITGFLESSEPASIVVLDYYKKEGENAELRLYGIVFNGKYYDCTRYNPQINTVEKTRYKYCGVEEYQGYNIFYLSNNTSLNYKKVFDTLYYSNETEPISREDYCLICKYH